MIDLGGTYVRQMVTTGTKGDLIGHPVRVIRMLRDEPLKLLDWGFARTGGSMELERGSDNDVAACSPGFLLTMAPRPIA